MSSLLTKQNLPLPNHRLPRFQRTQPVGSPSASEARVAPPRSRSTVASPSASQRGATSRSEEEEEQTRRGRRGFWFGVFNLSIFMGRAALERFGLVHVHKNSCTSYVPGSGQKRRKKPPLQTLGGGAHQHGRDAYRLRGGRRSRCGCVVDRHHDRRGGQFIKYVVSGSATSASIRDRVWALGPPIWPSGLPYSSPWSEIPKSCFCGAIPVYF